MMHGHEKSRSAIVAVKPTNKAERSAAEPVEPRAEAEGNAGQQSTHRAQYRLRVAQALARIRCTVAVDTRGGNRMRESCTYGSVRGAPSNGRPYRDRREFITLLGGAAAAHSLFWPLAARAQQPAMPVIGFLRSAPFDNSATHLVTAFRQGLKDAGFVEGQNVAVEYSSAENHLDRLPALAAELIRRPVAVIVGNNISALAAKAATTTVPIVFADGGDPVRDGLVASLNRPGGNVTGVVFFAGVLGEKRLDLLRQLVPKATTIAMLVYPNTADTEAERRDVQAAALAIGRQLIIL